MSRVVFLELIALLELKNRCSELGTLFIRREKRAQPSGVFYPSFTGSRGTVLGARGYGENTPFELSRPSRVIVKN